MRYATQMQVWVSCWLTFFFYTTSNAFSQQQVADRAFEAHVATPRYSAGEGPVVTIDEAHCNFHQLEGRYKPFADVLRADGYQLRASETKFSADALKGTRLLVIANALAPENEKDWSLPTPSAFEDSEIKAVVEWVKAGGSLLLIADHMPFPGAAEELAQEFGVVEWRNGFVAEREKLGPIRFELGGSSSTDISVPWVMTFTGSCFRAEEPFQPLLVLGKDATSLEPAKAWKFDSQTKRVAVEGYWQGAVRKFGRGRIALFGEAAMFTAQASGGSPFGLSDPRAEHNQEFLLQTIHWLTEQ